MLPLRKLEAVEGQCPLCGHACATLPEGLVVTDGLYFWNGKALEFSRREGEIFKFLLERRGRVLSREVAWSLLYGHLPNGGADPKIFDVFLTRIRKLLRASGIPLHVETYWGHGYTLVDGIEPEKPILKSADHARRTPERS